MGANAFSDISGLEVANIRRNKRCGQEATDIVGTMIYTSEIDLIGLKAEAERNGVPLRLLVNVLNVDSTSPFTGFAIDGRSRELATGWASILNGFDQMGTGAVATLAATGVAFLLWSCLCSPPDFIRIGVKGAPAVAQVDAKVVVEAG
jgi:hypothetical protein